MKILHKRSKARRDEIDSSDGPDSEAEFIQLNVKRLRRSPAPSPCTDRATAVPPFLLESSPTPERSVSSLPSIDSSLMQILHERFNLNEFRSGQYDAVHAAIEGRDVILRLPTGAGKTVAVLLPPLHTRSGITIIIVPLVALLRQQCLMILDRPMAAPVMPFYGGQPQELESDSKSLLSRPVATREYPLPPFVIMTPEQMVKNDMRAILGGLYRRGIIERFVIDEAQCMFTWADFRPAYKEIKKDLIERYPEAAKTFAGATLTDAHIEELRTSVCRDGGAHTTRVQQPLDRANLYYEVRYCETHRGERREEAALVRFVCEEVQKMKGTETGIVYCSRKKACKEIVEALSKENITSAEYFGGDSWDSAASGENGMTSAQQTKVARLWQEGSIRVIVATSAFGMGIDKPNVRFVAHLGTPKTLHDWYQDSGRAGRDGRTAKCVIFYSTGSFHTHADMHMWDVRRTFGETTALHSRGPEGQALQTEVMNSLRAMHRACLDGLAGSCLRRAILAPFGQAPAGNCGNCSACRMRAPVETIDLTAWARNALAALEFVSRDSQRTLRACKTDLVCLLHGSKGERFTGQLPQFHGTGRQLEGVLPLAQRKVSLLLDILLVNGVLDLNYKKRSTKREGQPEYYTVWRPGPRAEALRMDVEKISCPRALVL